jgi:proteasome lid subunit RPN8/RPN11
MSIIIPDDIRTAIAQHLVACYPREGCGVLVGARANATRIVIHEAAGLPNRSEQAGDRFEIDPLAYLKLEQRLTHDGGKYSVVGFFHSHPDGPAQPSHIDLEMARGLFAVTRYFYVYAIQSIAGGNARELTCWRLNPLLSAFDGIACTSH